MKASQGRAELNAASKCRLGEEEEKFFRPGTPSERTVPTTCIETIGGDPATAIRLSFQIKVF
jgi:hypothetical protein